MQKAIKHTLFYQLHYKTLLIARVTAAELTHKAATVNQLLYIPQPTHCSSDNTRHGISKTKQKEKENTFFCFKSAYKKWKLNTMVDFAHTHTHLPNVIGQVVCLCAHLTTTFNFRALLCEVCMILVKNKSKFLYNYSYTVTLDCE
jgi:hypothetical protein